MPSSIQAAVFREALAPLTIESVDLDDPGSHEVLIRTVASGVCHSDLHYVDGENVLAGYDDSAAVVLGHEGAGIVEAVGDAVTYLKPGDHVVACLSVFCGACDECLSGHPARCQANVRLREPGGPSRLSQDGRSVGQFVGLATYAEKMLVHENAVVKIDDDMPLDRAALLGCGVLTGVGAALNTAQVRPASTVAVIGCGGVGLSIIQGAYIAGARQIIAVDTFDSKLEMAMGLGATHTVNSARDNAVEAVRALADGKGVDYSFEAVGFPKLVRQCIEMLRVGGTATIVGVMPTDAVHEFPHEAIRGEKKLQTCLMGSNRFRTDIPNYIALYRQGRLKLDEMVSVTRPLSDINEAFRAMKAGEVARNVLTFN
jgi:S-(hydroxymethyl)glutathione dehydrogenase/alcohol dehydrogenase